MIYSAVNCFSIHMYVYRVFIQKIYICVYDQIILSFIYTMLGNYWYIKGTILSTLIKWNLPADYLDSYSFFIIRVNKYPLIRLTQLPLGDMLIHD